MIDLPVFNFLGSLMKSSTSARMGATWASDATVCFLVHLSPKKQDPNIRFGEHTCKLFGTMLYASFLQKFMIFVKVGLPAFFSGPSSAVRSFGYH